MALTTNQLGSNPVPFPFDDPVGGCAESGVQGGIEDFCCIVLRQRVGEAERVGATDICVGSFRGDELMKEVGGGFPVSHQSVSDDVGGQSGEVREAANDQAS